MSLNFPYCNSQNNALILGRLSNRTSDCVAHMANVYDVISHPAFFKSLNSLLIVPLVARTSEVSAFPMNTPAKSGQSRL
jgi:hypothetical protein